MGNYVSYHFPVAAAATGKVVLPDGATVHEFHEPITAAELMLDNPNHVVVEFDPAATGKRTPLPLRLPLPLPADKRLELKKAYLLLPAKRGKLAAPSSQEMRRSILRAGAVLRPRCPYNLELTGKFLPLLARMCAAGNLEKGSQLLEPVVKKKEVGLLDNVEKGKFRGEEEERPFEHLSRQFSGRGWRPSLETIEERMLEYRKLPHWLF